MGMPTENAHLLHSGSDESLSVVGGGGSRGDFSTVGLMLRETRERYGLTLRDVANALRIRVVYLHALEEGRFVDLPGRPYVVGFLRSYAEYFGLDGDEVVRRYRDERTDAARPAKLVFPEPPLESKFPVGAMLAILTVVSVLGYGAWQFIGSDEGDTRLAVTSVPSELAAESDSVAEASGQLAGSDVAHSADRDMIASLDDGMTTTTRSLGGAGGQASSPAEVARGGEPEPDATYEAEPADSGGSVIELSSASAASLSVYDEPGYDGPADASEETAIGPVASQSLSPSLLGFPNAGETVVPDDLVSLGIVPGATPDVAAEATVSDVEREATQVYGDVNTDSRVLLRATEDCWIQIQDQGGSDVFTRLLKAGEVYRVPNRDDLLLRMGNAGGLQVIVDGTTMPLLGGPGEVLRNVSLAPDALRASL